MKTFLYFLIAIISIFFRILVFAVKVALFAGIIWLIVSLCSCSASREESSRISDIGTSLSFSAGSADSVRHESLDALLSRRSLELTDLTITFPPPAPCLPPYCRAALRDQDPAPTDREPQPCIAGHRVPRHDDAVNDPQKPLTVSIGRISAAAESLATSASASDSVGISAAALRSDTSAHTASDKAASRSSPSALCRLILCAAAILGIISGIIVARRARK